MQDDRKGKRSVKMEVSMRAEAHTIMKETTIMHGRRSKVEATSIMHESE